VSSKYDIVQLLFGVAAPTYRPSFEVAGVIGRHGVIEGAAKG
jgi:hypothetical protein